MDQLSSSMQDCTLQPFPLMKLPKELIQRVLEQLLVTSDRHDPSCGMSALIAFSKASWQARKLAERIIFRRIDLMSAGPWRYYSQLARNRPTMDSPGLQTALVRPPPDFLRHIQSLSIHQFWDVNSISTDDSLAQIARGISRLLLKPATLRRLEIDGGDLLAKKVQGCLQQNGDNQFVYLKDITLSVEFRFLLKLTPKATHVSTSTREGYGMSSVLYNQAEVNDMMAMLKPLRGLRHLEVVVSDFLTSAGATIHVQIPTLSLQTLSIVSIRHPNHESNDDEHVPRIPMGLVLEMIVSQPTIHKITIPEAEDIDTGVPDRGGWSSIVECHNWGPAAVIAARFANIKDISVGYFFNALVRRDSDKGKVFLKRIPVPGCGHAVMELELKVVTAGDEGWAGHEGDAAWIVFESDGGVEEKPTCVVVNADFEAIDEIEESWDDF